MTYTSNIYTDRDPEETIPGGVLNLKVYVIKLCKQFS